MHVESSFLKSELFHNYLLLLKRTARTAEMITRTTTAVMPIIIPTESSSAFASGVSRVDVGDVVLF